MLAEGFEGLMVGIEALDRMEQALLGAVLRHGPVLADLVQVLRAEDLRKDAHQAIYGAALALWDAGRPVDAVSVGELLQRRGRFVDVGGAAYLAELLDQAATAAHAVYHAERVRDHGLLRRLVVVGQRIAALAEHPSGTAGQVLEEAERLLFALAREGVAGTAHRLDVVLHEQSERWAAQATAGHGLSGLSSGLADLDEITAGLQAGELVVLAARPSVGKTALGLGIALHVARAGRSVLVASLEQSRHELAARLVCSEARVDSHRLRRGHLTALDARAVAEAVERLRPAPLHIDDGAVQGLMRIAANGRRLRLREGIGLLVVDYLQLIDPEDRKAPRHEQVGQSARRLKGLARELGVPVLALAQLNREVESRADGRPRLSDLRDSGEIEQHADTVLLMHRPRPGAGVPEGLIEVLVAKQRNGPVGEVLLRYERQYLRFEDYAEQTPFEG